MLRLALTIASASGVLAGVALVVTGLSSAPPVPPPAAQPPIAPAMLVVPAGENAGVAVAAFEIDTLEVSVAEYDACVRADVCPLYASAADSQGDDAFRLYASANCNGGRRDRAADAMNCVDWDAASAYCAWVGKRLPTREEWWLAVGSKHPDHVVELHRPAPAEFGYFAAEWTTGAAKTGTQGGRASDVWQSRGPWDNLRYIGAWHTAKDHLGNAYDDWRAVNVRLPTIRFRCAR